MSVIEKTETTSISQSVRFGVVGGVIGSLAMAMYAMVVSNSDKHVGFFTPLYHIASAFTSPNAMMASMTEAMHGNEGYFNLSSAIVGAMVHMMTGAMAGAIFGVSIVRLRSSRAITIAAGAVFGLLVMAINSFIGLPIVAHLFGGGKPITDMAKIVGWGHFTIEHLLFGLTLGLVLAIKSPATTQVHTR